MNLAHVPGTFAVCRLPADAPLPDWTEGPGLVATVRASDELTVVCAASRVPESVEAQRDWACFRSQGPFGFDEAGVVAALIGPLSSAGIGVFVLCTFDGEHVLYPAPARPQVQDILQREGHLFAR